ncbi:DUF2478 domain-containing protein [Arenibaculum sp.]|uniref:DUF2478 domain-containing protein n=1 Tax=Arenibaculum sp. TaxID=2865862 RepID=UPI002E13BB1A|nr:DUF2478 domain-containing protein [Arenibaculum sp.]
MAVSPSARLIPPALPPAVVVHGPGSGVDVLISRFATALAGRGFRVGGVVQRQGGGTQAGGAVCADEMELVEIATGRAIPISQRLGRGSSSCRVDPAGVAEASALIRAARAGGLDLLVLNKFGGLESQGGGLASELGDAVAEGVPVLTSVNGKYLPDWLAFAGTLSRMLPPEEDALWRWWGGCRLYRDLLNGVEDDEVRRIECAPPWVLVRSARGCGVARMPEGAAVPAYRLRALGRHGLGALARRIEAWDPFDATLGFAAVNAHYNRPDLDAEAGNGLDAVVGSAGPAPGRLVVVGAFPDLLDRLPRAEVIDASPGEGRFPPEAADWLLPGAAQVVLTGSTLPNRTLPRLLDLAGPARVAMVGPSTTLSDRLFSYGIETLAGFVADDPDGLADAVAAGARPRQWTRFGRQVVRRRAGASGLSPRGAGSG